MVSIERYPSMNSLGQPRLLLSTSRVCLHSFFPDNYVFMMIKSFLLLATTAVKIRSLLSSALAAFVFLSVVTNVPLVKFPCSSFGPLSYRFYASTFASAHAVVIFIVFRVEPLNRNDGKPAFSIVVGAPRVM